MEKTIKQLKTLTQKEKENILKTEKNIVKYYAVIGEYDTENCSSTFPHHSMDLLEKCENEGYIWLKIHGYEFEVYGSMDYTEELYDCFSKLIDTLNLEKDYTNEEIEKFKENAYDMDYFLKNDEMDKEEYEEEAMQLICDYYSFNDLEMDYDNIIKNIDNLMENELKEIEESGCNENYIELQKKQQRFFEYLRKSNKKQQENYFSFIKTGKIKHKDIVHETYHKKLSEWNFI